jgi:hypothetical protein
LWLSGSLAAAALVLAACTSGPSASGSTSSSVSGQSKPLPPTVCERKIVTANELTSLLPGSISMKALPGDPQSCIFDGEGGASVTISVRPGLGDVSVNAWTTGRVPVPAVPVGGIGDRAVWQDTMRELIATKQNVLCDISAQGAKGSAADVQKVFAELCGKIWAAQ